MPFQNMIGFSLACICGNQKAELSITSLLAGLLQLLLLGLRDLGLEVVAVDGLQFLLDGGGDHLVLLHEGLSDECG